MNKIFAALLTCAVIAPAAAQASEQQDNFYCRTQVRIAALNYLVRNLNDNNAGPARLLESNEIVAGQGNLRNGMAEVKAIYRDPNVTSVHDLREITLSVLYHPNTCTILDVQPE